MQNGYLCPAGIIHCFVYIYCQLLFPYEYFSNSQAVSDGLWWFFVKLAAITQCIYGITAFLILNIIDRRFGWVSKYWLCQLPKFFPKSFSFAWDIGRHFKLYMRRLNFVPSKIHSFMACVVNRYLQTGSQNNWLIKNEAKNFSLNCFGENFNSVF